MAIVEFMRNQLPSSKMRGNASEIIYFGKYSYIVLSFVCQFHYRFIILAFSAFYLVIWLQCHTSGNQKKFGQCVEVLCICVNIYSHIRGSSIRFYPKNTINTKSLYCHHTWRGSLELPFYPRPVLAFGYCRCLRLSVCPPVRPSVCAVIICFYAW